MQRKEVIRVRKTVGVFILSLALLAPAQMVQAMSDDEHVYMQVEKLEKQLEMLKVMIKTRIAKGEKTPSDKIKMVKKMIKMTQKELDDIEDTYRED
jgi:hypothetical protein